MKFSDLKLTGVFRVRANSGGGAGNRSLSSRWNLISCSSAGADHEKSPSRSVAPSPRNRILKRTLSAATAAIPRPSIYMGEITAAASETPSGYFTPNPQWEVDEVFKLFDKDRDGKISCYELGLILRRLDETATEEELEMMVSDADIDGDGYISIDEFEQLNIVHTTNGAAADLVDAFNVFDTDRDGKISVYELHRVFVALGDDGCTLEDCLRMIKRVDTDGDGYVSFDDFVSMMTRS